MLWSYMSGCGNVPEISQGMTGITGLEGRISRVDNLNVQELTGELDFVLIVFFYFINTEGVGISNYSSKLSNCE